MKRVWRLTENSEPASRIRLMGLKMGGCVWVVAVICCLLGGVGIVMALCEATLAAVGGVFAWIIYRETSGRYDGLAIVMAFIIVPAMHILDGPSRGLIGGIVIQMAVMIPLSWFMGRVSVLRDTRRCQPDAESTTGAGS